MDSSSLIESEHYYYYSTSKPVSAAMLAESLIGLDGVVNHSAKILGSMFKTRVKFGGVYIRKIEFGSYKDDFTVRLLLGKGKKLEKNIDALRKKLGLDKMETKTLIKWAIIVIIGFGIYKFAIEKNDAPATISITNSFNNWGKDVGMSGEELLAKLETIVKNKNDLKKQVVRLTRPLATEDNGKIMLDNEDNFSIAPVAVAAVPTIYEIPEVEEPIQNFTKAMIVIRAADLDRQTGWYGIALEINEHRVPVHLENSVDRNKIILGKFNEVDITAKFQVKKNGDRFPIEYIITKLYEPVVIPN